MNNLDQELKDPRLIDVHGAFVNSVGDLAIYREQEIPQWWLDQLKDARIESANAPAGDFHRVASIPVAVHERWLREGFDCTREPISAAVARLKRQGLDAFMATSKVI